MRTVDEVVSMPEVVCTIMAVQVSKVMAVNLLRRGATVVLSQVTNEGRGIQLLKLGEKYFHWMGGRWQDDRIDDFPDPTMAGEHLVKELRRRSSRP